MPTTMKDASIVAGFGALGALSRYGMNQVGHTLTTGFPMGTLLANLAGCFLLGYISERWIPEHDFGKRLKLGITTGFIGAFTTFSAFTVEGIHYLQDAQYLWFGVHAIAHVVGGITLATLGFQLAKRTKAVTPE